MKPFLWTLATLFTLLPIHSVLVQSALTTKEKPPKENVVFVVLANIDDASDLTTLNPIVRDLAFITFGERSRTGIASSGASK